jgi:hypothetical protein
MQTLFPKPCMLHDVFRKGWWTFKIKVRLICLIYFKETFTNEFYLYNCSINSVGYGIRCIQNSRVRFILLASSFFIMLNKKQLKLTAFKVLRSFFLFRCPDNWCTLDLVKLSYDIYRAWCFSKRMVDFQNKGKTHLFDLF